MKPKRQQQQQKEKHNLWWNYLDSGDGAFLIWVCAIPDYIPSVWESS